MDRLLESFVDSTSDKKNDYALLINSIVNIFPGNFWWKDLDGKYMGCNLNVSKLLGLPEPNFVVGKTDYDLPWRETAAELRAHDQRVIRNKATEILYEDIKTASGEVLTFLVIKSPLYNSDNDVIGTMGTSIDVTEQKQLEKELIQAKELAETASQAKTEFLYNMRHDIRTPFSGILSLAQVLASDEKDLTKKEYLTQIAKSSEELLLYLNEILEFTQLESGSVPILSKPFDLHQLIESVVDTFKPSVSSSGVALEFEYSELPDWVAGDRFRVQRILINLVSNAIKFTSNGHIKITVSLLREENKNLIVKLSVEDTGMGIPLEKQDIIFEKFSKIGSSYDASNTGKGLGLRAVKALVAELEGNIFLKSKVGCGSIFSCIIPFEKLLISDVDIINRLTKYE